MKIHGYQVQKKLGEGESGVIYEVEKDNHIFAMKQSNLKSIDALIEISLYQHMSHPNIISPYEYFISEDKIYMVMPKYEISLEDIDISDNDHMIRLFLFQLLSALDYLHTNGISHNDIAPINILISGTNAYLIDFGLGKKNFSPELDLYNLMESIHQKIQPEYNKMCGRYYYDEEKIHNSIHSLPISSDLREVMFAGWRGDSAKEILSRKYFSSFHYKIPSKIQEIEEVKSLLPVPVSILEDLLSLFPEERESLLHDVQRLADRAGDVFSTSNLYRILFLWSVYSRYKHTDRYRDEIEECEKRVQMTSAEIELLLHCLSFDILV